MRKLGALRVALMLFIALGVPFIVTQTVFAADGDVGKVENFLNSIIKVVVILTGSVSVLFIAIGGFGYATSSGDPEKLDRSKRTLLYACIGLAIAIGALVIKNIVGDAATKAFG